MFTCVIPKVSKQVVTLSTVAGLIIFIIDSNM